MMFSPYLSKKLVALAFLLAPSFIFAPYASAQLSLSEKKAWKRELKKLTPEHLKKMVEENAYLSSALTLYENENSDLKTLAFKQEQEINFFKSEIEDLRHELKTREIQLGLVTEEGEQWDSGVVFKVQIGALKPSDFSQKQRRTYNLEVEEGNTYMHYVIGNFRKYREADALKKHMRKVGMTRAWIVPYKDGKRVPLKEVLDFVFDD